jgi:prevent-host-death family protein
MNQVTKKSTVRTRRIGVAQAKSQFSEVLRHAADGPTIIHSRSRDVAVVIAIEDYDRLTSEQSVGQGGARFIDRVEALKQRYNGGVDDFDPAPATIRPVDPFPRGRRAGR